MCKTTADTSCIVCGYGLRGLARTGVCPECGSDVARSLRGDRLRYADQHWLACIHLGMNVVWWCVAAGMIVIIAIALMAVTGIAWRPSGWHPPGSVPGSVGSAPNVPIVTWLATIIVLAWSAAMIVGLWLLTIREPRLDEKRNWNEPALRIISLVMVPSIGLVFGIELNLLSPIVQPSITALLRYLPVILLVVHAVMMADRLRGLERRCVSRDKSREPALRRIREHARGGAIFIALLYALTAFASTRSANPVVFFVVWLLAIGPARSTIIRIGEERAAAGASGEVGSRDAHG